MKAWHFLSEDKRLGYGDALCHYGEGTGGTMIYILMRFDDDFAIEIDSVWDSREQAESHAEYLRVSED